MDENQNIIRTNFKYFYSLDEKIKIVDKYMSIDPKTNLQYTKKEICRLYNIDHKQLDRFILNYENYKNEKNKHNKKTLHKGSKTNFSEEEQKIILDIVDSALANFTPINYILVTQIIQKKIQNFRKFNISFYLFEN